MAEKNVKVVVPFWLQSHFKSACRSFLPFLGQKSTVFSSRNIFHTFSAKKLEIYVNFFCFGALHIQRFLALRLKIFGENRGGSGGSKFRHVFIHISHFPIFSRHFGVISAQPNIFGKKKPILGLKNWQKLPPLYINWEITSLIYCLSQLSKMSKA